MIEIITLGIIVFIQVWLFIYLFIHLPPNIHVSPSTYLIEFNDSSYLLSTIHHHCLQCMIYVFSSFLFLTKTFSQFNLYTYYIYYICNYCRWMYMLLIMWNIIAKCMSFRIETVSAFSPANSPGRSNENPIWWRWHESTQSHSNLLCPEV